MAHPAYNNAEYQRNRKLLIGLPCFCGCGKPSDTVDHIVPKSKGGGPQMSNLRPAYHRCNSSRGNRTKRREVNSW